MSSDLFNRGLKIRSRVMGKAYVKKSFATPDPITQDIQNLLTTYGYGAIWGRSGLKIETRSLLTIAVLTVLNHPEELRGHIRGALNLGIADKEIIETLIHLLPYAGAPAMQNGLRAAKAVFTDRDADILAKKSRLKASKDQ